MAVFAPRANASVTTASAVNAGVSSSRRTASRQSLNIAGILAQSLLHLLGNHLDLVHHPKQIAAPQSGDLRLGVATADQFEGDVEGFVGAVPPVDAAAAVEV